MSAVMLWRSILGVACSLMISQCFALEVQRPLVGAKTGLADKLSPPFVELQRVVDERLFWASPVAKPCYNSQHSSLDCLAVEGNKTDDYWLPHQPSGYYYSNWASCQAKGETCAVPVDGHWDTAAENATCWQGSVPDFFIKVSNINDIRLGLKYATDTKTPLVVKNTGHDWKGRSAGPGAIALWTHGLQSNASAGGPVTPILLEANFKPLGCDIPSGETVLHFAAGEQWAGVYQFAEDHDLAVLGGTCPSVGVAGWLQGGGHSPLSPVFGMGVDNVRQIDLITPQGDLMTANECMNPDLYFALRGGGAGTWGVITNITYKAVPKFKIQELTANLTMLKEDSVVQDFFQILTSQAVEWADKGWGGYIKTATSLEIVKPIRDLTGAHREIQPLLDFFDEHSVRYNLTTRTSWFEYYTQHLQAPEAHIGQYSGAVASRLLPPRLFVGEERDELVSNLTELHKSKFNLWLMLVTPKAFPHTHTSALHPTWSDAVWSIRINAKWDQYHNQSADASWDYFNSVHRAMEPLRKLAPEMGVAINEADVWEKDPEDSFWGKDNYQVLLAIKRKIDPDNVMTNYGAVAWEPDDARFKCYPKQKRRGSK